MSSRRARKMPEEEHINHERWLVTYADMITLLMVLFIVMFAISQVDQKKFNELKDGLAAGFGSSSSVLEDSNSVLDANGQQPISPQLGAETNGQKSSGTSSQQGTANAGATESTTESANESDAQAAAQAAAAEAAQLLATKAQIESELKRRGLLGDVRFTLDDRGLVLSLVSRHIVFAPDLATLTPRGEEILSALGPVLADLDQQLEIAGHTNQERVKPRYFASDWDLSAARAITVLKYLAHSSGIPLGRLHATAYGHTRPLVPPAEPDSQRLNRRVDVIVLRHSASLITPETAGTVGADSGTDTSAGGPVGTTTGDTTTDTSNTNATGRSNSGSSNPAEGGDS